MALRNAANLPACIQPGLSHDLQRALQLCAKPKNRLEGLAALASTLKFDGISYLVMDDRANTDCVSVHLTTAGRDWSTRYAKHHYHSIDPRIIGTQGRHVPIVWDAAREAADGRIRNFLDHAGQFRICSGVAIPLHDVRVGRVVVAWDSATSHADGETQSTLESSLGTLTLLTAFLHEAMLAHCLPGLAGRARSTLSNRERNCLGLAAHGMVRIPLKMTAVSDRT